MRITTVNLAVKIGELTKKWSNLPEKYIKRSVEKVYYKTPNLPNYMRKEIKKKRYYFDIHPPWAREFEEINAPNSTHINRKVFVEPIKQWSIFKGDRVEILVGKDKGKQGIVSDVIQERNWVLVEGLNTYLRTMGKTKKFPGLLIQQEAPLLVTNEVALVDPTDMLPVQIEWRYTEDGQKVRVSKRSERIIPIPIAAQETIDFKSKSVYVEREKDTPSSEVEKITFEPSLETFEMEIMRLMGIKEDRVEAKSFWY